MSVTGVAVGVADEGGKRMKIAVALFGDEISPRFDCCTGLLTKDRDGHQVRVDLRGRSAEARVEEVVDCRPDCLLCGGIRRCDVYLFTECGIRVIEELSGDAQTIAQQYKSGTLVKGNRNCVTKAEPRGYGPRRKRHGGQHARL